MAKLFLICGLIVAGVIWAVGAGPGKRPDPERFRQEIEAFFTKEEPVKGGIVFTGSSSIRLWPNLQGDFPELPVVNRGFGGSVANDLIVHFDQVVASMEPKLLVTYTGSNDLNEKLSVDESFEDYTKFLEIARDRFPDLRVILNSVKVSPKRAQQIPRVHKLNRRLKEWAADRDWVRYVDGTSSLVDENGRPKADLFQEDALHLNEAGYEQWRKLLEPVVREEWEKVKP